MIKYTEAIAPFTPFAPLKGVPKKQAIHFHLFIHSAVEFSEKNRILNPCQIRFTHLPPERGSDSNGFTPFRIPFQGAKGVGQ